MKAYKQCRANNSRLKINWTKERQAVMNFEAKRQSNLA